MSAHVSIHRDGSNQLHIELRQTEGEVIRFGLFVLVIVESLYALVPDARSSPGWLVAALIIAATWSAIALSAQEAYTIDDTAPPGVRRERPLDRASRAEGARAIQQPTREGVTAVSRPRRRIPNQYLRRSFGDFPVHAETSLRRPRHSRLLAAVS